MPKENEGSKANSNLMVGLIAGAIVGAVAAILLSPKTGKENRQIVRENFIKGRERIAKGVERIRNRQDARDQEKV